MPIFKMNSITIITNDEMNNNNDASFSYLLESCDMWHDMLKHVNYSSTQSLINIEYLPSIVFEKNHKC